MARHAAAAALAALPDAGDSRISKSAPTVAELAETVRAQYEPELTDEEISDALQVLTAHGLAQYVVHDEGARYLRTRAGSCASKLPEVRELVECDGCGDIGHFANGWTEGPRDQDDGTAPTWCPSCSRERDQQEAMMLAGSLLAAERASLRKRELTPVGFYVLGDGLAEVLIYEVAIDGAGSPVRQTRAAVRGLVEDEYGPLSSVVLRTKRVRS